MNKKSDLIRCDRKFKKYIEDIEKKLMLKGIKVSRRRITLGLTRLDGLTEALVNANWLDEEIRRVR